MADTEVERQLYVVIGGTGDLMRRKLLPALYRLLSQGPGRGKVHVLAVARNPTYTDETYRQWACDILKESGVPGPGLDANWCEASLHYQSLGKETPEDFRRLAQRVEELEKKLRLPGNRVFNVAIPPASFDSVMTGLGETGLNQAPGWTRIVVEKPFGSDVSTAQEWNALIHRYFDESQVYRIDHYLGKETVQNLIAFRFANAIFESLWNRDRIQSVQISVAESVGVSQRGNFFDQVGTLRDMVQNHLTQLLTVTAMELPVALAREEVRDEKVKVLKAVCPIGPDSVVFGQYTAGEVKGQAIPAYPEEAQVAADSQTETFVALRLFINNSRWYGVPFYLRTGKRLPVRTTQIVVEFDYPELQCFEPFDCKPTCNLLIITIEPNEGFHLRFEVKTPGEPFQLSTQQLSFNYRDVFGPLREAYETLLYDVMKGDRTFFVRADEVEASWRIYDPLLKHRPPVYKYAAGTWGPKEADALMKDTQWFLGPSDGRQKR